MSSSDSNIKTINVVLYAPEIPQNTGNIMRTCVGTGVLLHLIKPLGFKIDDKKLRRSAVDYYEHIEYKTYDSWEEFQNSNIGLMLFLTRYGRKPLSEFNVTSSRENIYLIFGNESTGMPVEILRNNINNCFRLPMNDKIRSLNLSNSVAISIYEVLRQLGYPNLSFSEPATFKGSNYLMKEE